MSRQYFGYVRVSSFDQNPQRQLENIAVDRIFTDKASGKNIRRPQLEALLAFARESDTVVVHSNTRKKITNVTSMLGFGSFLGFIRGW